MQFQIDGSNAGSPVPVALAGGLLTASFSTATLTPGTHNVTVSYSGDSSFAGSSNSLSGGLVVGSAAGSDVTVTFNPSTGVLNLKGDSGDNTLTVKQSSPGVLQVAGTGTTAQAVNNADTTTSVTSSANPSVFGQPVTFT